MSMTREVIDLIRPHLEYFVQIWAPYFRKENHKLQPEKSLEDMSSEARVKGLGMGSMEDTW